MLRIKADDLSWLTTNHRHNISVFASCAPRLLTNEPIQFVQLKGFGFCFLTYPQDIRFFLSSCIHLLCSCREFSQHISRLRRSSKSAWLVFALLPNTLVSFHLACICICNPCKHIAAFQTDCTRCLLDFPSSRIWDIFSFRLLFVFSCAYYITMAAVCPLLRKG